MTIAQILVALSAALESRDHHTSMILLAVLERRCSSRVAARIFAEISLKLT